MKLTDSELTNRTRTELPLTAAVVISERAITQVSVAPIVGREPLVVLTGTTTEPEDPTGVGYHFGPEPARRLAWSLLEAAKAAEEEAISLRRYAEAGWPAPNPGRVNGGKPVRVRRATLYRFDPDLTDDLVEATELEVAVAQVEKTINPDAVTIAVGAGRNPPTKHYLEIDPPLGEAESFAVALQQAIDSLASHAKS